MFKKIKAYFFSKPSEPTRNPISEQYKRDKATWDASAFAAGLKPNTMNLVFTAKDGSQYYTWASPLDLTVERVEKIKEYSDCIRLGLDPDYLDAWQKLSAEAVSRNDLKTVKRLLEDLALRRSIKLNTKPYLRLACAYLTRQDENPYIFDEVMEAQKLSDLAKDPHLRAFFLNFALEMVLQATPADSTNSFSKQRWRDTLAFLKAEAEAELDQALSISIKL